MIALKTEAEIRTGDPAAQTRVGATVECASNARRRADPVGAAYYDGLRHNNHHLIAVLEWVIDAGRYKMMATKAWPKAERDKASTCD